MTRTLLAALLVFTLPAFLRAADKEPNADQFASICSTAKAMDESPDGKAYEARFSDAISNDMVKALQACGTLSKPPYWVNLVFVIGGNGKVEHVFAEPGNPVSGCVAAKLTGVKLPKPPKGEWLQLVNINVHL